MTPVVRSTVPIASAAELSLWWAEVLSEERLPDTALAMLWLDPSATGSDAASASPAWRSPTCAPPGRSCEPTMPSRRRAWTKGTSRSPSRPGGADITEADEQWADVLDALLVDRDGGTWSLHLAAGGWITPVVPPPTARFDPRRVSLRPPGEMLDRRWPVDQNSSHDDTTARHRQGPIQPG